MAGLIFGGFSYAKQDIQNNLVAQMSQEFENNVQVPDVGEVA